MTRERDFWSRRREAVRAEADVEADADLAIAEAKSRAELEGSTDETVLAKLDLPDPDEMEVGDDFSKFMARAVPERLRRRALRKLWLSNPLLANVDGLVDYGEDFTDSALVVENLQTAYQVGKGMLKHVLELERQREAEEAETVEVAETAEAAAQASEPGPLTLDADSEVAAQDQAVAGEQPETDTLDSAVVEETFPPPRRMQFKFETDVA